MVFCILLDTTLPNMRRPLDTISSTSDASCFILALRAAYETGARAEHLTQVVRQVAEALPALLSPRRAPCLSVWAAPPARPLMHRAWARARDRRRRPVGPARSTIPSQAPLDRRSSVGARREGRRPSQRRP
eukprot:scaffold1115_cov390-Prasinococcus_capsulatus_cf.AAC.5